MEEDVPKKSFRGQVGFGKENECDVADRGTA